MKVLIIEDEKPASQKLIRLLNKIDSNIEIIETIESVEKAVNWWLSNQHPDLILMDIQLEDGICFEIFEKCNIKTPVIFTTAYDDYTLKAFKVNSVDYLLKPVSLLELEKAVNKYRTIHWKEFDVSVIGPLIRELQPKIKERFLIKIGEHLHSVQVSSINYFFVKDRCNFINIDKGKNYIIDYSLDKIEQLVDPKLFFRVNRNFIINFNSIKDILAYSSSRLRIYLDNTSDNLEILVSRERVADFKGWMDR